MVGNEIHWVSSIGAELNKLDSFVLIPSLNLSTTMSLCKFRNEYMFSTNKSSSDMSIVLRSSCLVY